LIFFFYGPNTFASRRKLQEMVETYVTKSGSDFGLERIDGKEASYDQIIAAMQASPFLAKTRLVIIENLSANKSAVERVLAALDAIPDTTVAVFHEGEADQRTTYFKTMSKLPKAVKFDKLGQSQLLSWTKREVEKLGGTIERPALNALVEAVGDDQWRLEQEVNKLVNFAPAVTLENVKNLVSTSSTESIFDLVDAMSAGNTKRALAVYRGLIGERTNEVYILTMVTWQLRNLLLAKTSGMSNSGELAKAAGMSPFVAGKALQKGKSLSEEMLKQAFMESVEADYTIKSGQGTAEQVVEDLIYRVAEAAKS
jgi:DNA polymerase-3 subunit delta